MLKVLRRGSTRYLALSGVLLTILLCLYYAGYNGSPAGNVTAVTSSVDVAKASSDQQRHQDAVVPADRGFLTAEERVPEADLLEPEPDSAITQDTCSNLAPAKTDVDTVEQFRKFEFQVRPNSDRYRMEVVRQRRRVPEGFTFLHLCRHNLRHA
jgi:hypothetical protein